MSYFCVPRHLISRVLIPGLLLLGAVSAQAADVTDLEIDVTVDGDFFTPGEDVNIFVDQCNPTDETIAQFYACPCCHDSIEVLDAEGEPVADCSGGCILPLIQMIWEPGECKTLDYTWEQLVPECFSGDQATPGTYQIRHTFQFTNPVLDRQTLSEPFILGDPIVSVPTLSELSLAALASLLALGALLKIRARS